MWVLEIGRSQPSREMILRLAERLEIPLRDRNVLLTLAGFAAVFPETPLNDKSLAAAHNAIELILRGLEPNPSFAIDRHWVIVTTNKAANILLTEVDGELLKPPINLLRLFLHPKGLMPQIINFREWRRHLLAYLHRQVEITADTVLMALVEELESYSHPSINNSLTTELDYSRFAVPLQLMTSEGELSFIGTVTVFGTPIDITLSELAIESFFAANEKTTEILRKFEL
jgi:hypothetical protein